MANGLGDKLRRLLPDLLKGLTKENVETLALLMESDGGLHTSEMDTIMRATTNQDAVSKLCMYTRARGDSSIVSLEKALRAIDKPELADKLAPDVPSLRTDGASAGGSSSYDGAAAPVKKPSENLASNLRAATAKLSAKLTESESDEIIAKLYAKGYITSREKEALKKASGATSKASELLDILEKKDDVVIQFVVQILYDLNRSGLADLVKFGDTARR